jgi:hypothetical protein
MSAAGDFETVAWVYSPSDLALLLGLLENEDIFVLTVGRGHAAADPAITTALGGVTLRVHSEEADAARALFAGLDPVPFRARLPIELVALFLLSFLGWFVIAPPPPRQIPCFVGVAARREA